MKQRNTIDTSTCHHPLFGLAAPQHGWVPSPSYLLRRARITEYLDRIPSGSVLEVGCGAGGLIADFLERGWRCCAVDDSPSALKILQDLYGSDSRVTVSSSLLSSNDEQEEAFDLIAAFEVLEHIEYDEAALRSWLRRLKENGLVLLSVPAHRSRWSAADEWAGHFRRYDRADIENLLAACGLQVLELECYGFPLGNVVEPLRAWLKWKTTPAPSVSATSHAVSDAADVAARTARSGTERTIEMKLYPHLSGILGSALMRTAFSLQRIFRHRDVGVGYFVVAKRAD